MEGTNRQVRLRARPTGMVDASTFDVVSEPLPTLADGEALVRIVYLSVDPTQRVWIERDSYLPAVPIGDVVRAGGIGVVVESRNEAYPVGAIVTGLLGWQEYAVVDSGMRAGGVLPDGVPLAPMLSVFGSSGMTAYFGMLEIGAVAPGETVVVSGAAGSVGSVAGQLAKIHDCRVIGIAGSAEKCAWVTDELGFDACIDYKGEDVGARLRELCPDGIDVYFDNVGGAILDEVLAQIAMHARIVLCGAISEYNAIGEGAGIRNYFALIGQRGRMEGFIIIDYLARFPEAIARMVEWAGEGRLQWRETIVEGLERAPDALSMLFTGENIGKLLVKVSDEP